MVIRSLPLAALIREQRQTVSEPKVARFADAVGVDDAIGSGTLFTLAADDAGAEQFVGEQLPVGSPGDHVGEGAADVDGKLPTTYVHTKRITNYELQITNYELRVTKRR